MNNQKFIMIGSKTISKEIFRSLLRPMNNHGFKPSGGFWSSKYISPYLEICDWYNFLADADAIAKQKNIEDGVIFTLKENSKILTIESDEDIKKLAQKYPSYHHILGYYQEYPSNKDLTFNFEELENDYDAIYVNYTKLHGYRTLTNSENETFDTWSVNTLLLLNLDCIEEYNTVHIKDYKEYGSRPFINKESAMKKVKPRSPYYQELYNLVESMFVEKVSTCKKTFKDYDEYLSYLVNIVNECTKEIINNSRISNIQNILHDEGADIKREIIARNISLNHFSHYLNSNKEATKKLERARHKGLKTYHID